MNTVQPSHRVIMNMGILYVRMAVTVLLSLYATRLTLAALGANDFGIFNVVGGAIAMLTFLSASMAATVQRFMSFAQGQGDTARQNRIFNVSVVLHLFIALALLVVMELAGLALFGGILNIAPERVSTAWIVYQFAIVSTLITVVGAPYDAVINARENMVFFAVLGVIESILKVAIATAITSSSGDRLFEYGVLTALLTLTSFLIKIVHCHLSYAECSRAQRNKFEKPLVREMTGFAGWSFLGSSTGMLANYGQGVVLNAFFGASINAAQGVCNQISGQLGAFAGTMLRALNPVIAKSEGAGNRSLMVEASKMGSKVGFLLLMLLYVPMLIETPYLFALWLKDVPEYAVAFCRLLLLRNLIEQLYVTLISAISAVGDIRGFQTATTVLNLLPLPLSCLLFWWGLPPEALYFAFLIYSLATFAIVLAYARSKFSMPVRSYLVSVVGRCLVALLVMLIGSAVPLLFLDVGPLRLCLVLVLNVVLFFPSVWYVIFSRKDRQTCARIVVGAASHLRARFHLRVNGKLANEK